MLKLPVSSHVLAAIALILAFTLSFHKIRDMDVGFHLKAGEDILKTGHVPVKDTFTYTVNDHDYVDIYWFYQVCLALQNAVGGPFGIVFTHASLTALAFWLVWRRFRFSDHPVTSIGPAVLLAGVLAASYHYSIRPHAFSWVFLNLILLVLERYRRDPQTPLWPLPAVMLVWANSHTLYPLAWIAMGCHFIGLWMETGKPDRKLIIACLASFAACFINPYGWKGVWLPFQQFGFLQEGDLYKQYITEYRSPFVSDWLKHYRDGGRIVLAQPVFFFHAFAAVAAVAALCRIIRRKIRVHEFLIAAFFSYVMAIALKNVGVFVFAVLPLVMDGFADVTAWFAGRLRRLSAFLPPTEALNAALVVLAAAFFLRVVTNAYYVSWNSRDETGYDYGSDNVLPHRAAGFLLEHGLTGKTLNHLNFGGFFAYLLPQKVFIDGRNEVIGQEFFRHYQMMSSPQGISNMLKEYAPDIVAFPHRAAPSWRAYFSKRPDWRLAYADEVAAIYLRDGYANEVPAMTEEAFAKSVPGTDPKTAKDLLAEKKPDTFLQGFYKKQDSASAENSLLTFAVDNGWYRAGVRAGLAALAKTTKPNIALYFNLGQAFRLSGDHVRARDCYARYVAEIPDPALSSYITKVDALLEQKGRKAAP